MGFLTSRTIAPTVTTNDLVHIVITGDTSQGNPSGSSYKATIGQIGLAIGSGSTVTISGGTDISVTGIYPNFGISFTGVTSGDYLPLSGGTVSGSTNFTNGLTANTISATTYLNLPVTTDVFVTGGTYSAGTSMFTNNTGGTFNVSGFYTGETSNVNTLTTGIGLSADTTTGNVTIINTDPDQTVVLNNGTNISVTGTYPNFTIDVTGLTDFNTFTTGFTYSSNTFTILDNSGNTFDATFTEVTGLTVNGDLIVTGNTSLEGLTATTISATTYQNLPLGIYGTGLTFNTGNYDLTLNGQNGTLDTISLSILASDLTVTGGTYDSNTGIATFTNNTGGTFNVTGFLTGMTDTFVTGGTYSDGTITFTNTSGGTFDVTGLTTGDTTTITGATSVGTGLTIFNSVVDRNIQINSITGDTLEKITTSLSANTIEVGINEQNLDLWSLVVQGNRLLSGNVSYVSGLTFSISPLEYIIDGQIYNIPSSTQVTLNSGDTTFDRIDVIFADISGNTGVLEGTASSNPEKPIVDSETQVEVTFVSVPANSTTPAITTELIYDEFTGEPTEWNFLKFGNQTFRISGDSTAQSYSGSKSISVSGLTTSGGSWSNGFLLSATTLTDVNQFATLQFAIRNMSGNSNNTLIRIRFLNQTGIAISSPVYLWGSSTTGQYVNYSTSNTSSWQLISIPLWKFYLTNTNVYGVRFDYAVGSTVARHYFDKIEFVEGVASSPPSNSWTTIKGDSTTTITAPNPNATLTISGGTNISSSISGTSTVVLNLDNNINLNGVTASTISATTYQNLPSSTFTGGTVNGSTNFTNGLSANTISATTYQNLPISGLTEGNNINISGSNSNYTISVTGLTQGLSGDYLPLSGGTVTGNTVFTSGLTANTISATTYQNLPDNVTGNYLPLSGGTVSGDTTITANLTVSGNSGINWFSSNTSSDLVRITQTGNGNAFVVEDSTNPDSTPFIINTSGNTSIGSTSFFTTPGSGLGSKLSLSLGSATVPYSGLPISTAMAIESNQTTSIGLFSPDLSSSQIYFGTPGDVFGAFLRWDFTNKNLVLSTSSSGGKVVFLTGTGTGTEAARIDQNGNFGIGLTSPTQKLEVSGNTRIYGGITADTISATTANTETLVISNTPTTDPTNNNVLVRNTATGIIGLKDFTHYNFGLYVQTGDSATVVNTIVETTILDSGIGSLSIPANYFTPGDSFNVKIGGIVSANNNDVITIKIKSGSVILGTDTITFTNSVTNRPWDFNCDFTIRTIGAPTVASIVANGVFTYSVGSDVYGGSFNTLNNTTFDTTNPNTLDFTITWGTASAGNSIYSSMCILKKTF